MYLGKEQIQREQPDAAEGDGDMQRVDDFDVAHERQENDERRQPDENGDKLFEDVVRVDACHRHQPEAREQKRDDLQLRGALIRQIARKEKIEPLHDQEAAEHGKHFHLRFLDLREHRAAGNDLDRRDEQEHIQPVERFFFFAGFWSFLFRQAVHRPSAEDLFLTL